MTDRVTSASAQAYPYRNEAAFGCLRGTEKPINCQLLVCFVSMAGSSKPTSKEAFVRLIANS